MFFSWNPNIKIFRKNSLTLKIEIKLGNEPSKLSGLN